MGRERFDVFDGTPRMVLDQTGSLTPLKRHDYLPFGEELFAPTSGRTAAQGYASGDGVRQHFTQKERDNETGLDYFGARYYASMQGRFTGVDPYDINLERQDTSDLEEAEALFRNYIKPTPALEPLYICTEQSSEVCRS